jgi:hypothetical protein
MDDEEDDNDDDDFILEGKVMVNGNDNKPPFVNVNSDGYHHSCLLLFTTTLIFIFIFIEVFTTVNIMT